MTYNKINDFIGAAASNEHQVDLLDCGILGAEIQKNANILQALPQLLVWAGWMAHRLTVAALIQQASYVTNIFINKKLRQI